MDFINLKKCLVFAVLSASITFTPSCSNIEKLESTLTSIGTTRVKEVWEESASNWLYNFATVLNGSLQREAVRRGYYAKINPEGYEIHKRSINDRVIKPDLSVYLSMINSNKGKLFSNQLIEKYAKSKKLNLIAPKLLMYYIYMKSYAEWEKNPAVTTWQAQLDFFNQQYKDSNLHLIFPHAFLSERIYEEGEYYFQDLSPEISRILCPDTGEKYCGRFSHDELIKNLNISKLNLQQRKELFQKTFEIPLKIPNWLRAKVYSAEIDSIKVDKLEIPVVSANYFIDKQGVSISKQGILYQMHLPKNLNLLSMYIHSSNAILENENENANLDKLWQQYSGLSPLDAQNLHELSAVLTVLNQPIYMGFSLWSVKEAEKGFLEKPKDFLSDIKRGIFGENTSVEVTKDGKIDIHIKENKLFAEGREYSFTKFNEVSWKVMLPEYQWRQIFSAYKSINAVYCSELGENSKPFAAAFKYLLDAGYKPATNSYLQQILFAVEKCGNNSGRTVRLKPL